MNTPNNESAIAKTPNPESEISNLKSQTPSPSSAQSAIRLLQSAIPLDLQSICRRHRINPPAGPSATFQDVIYAFQLKIQQLQTHRAATASPHSADYFEWKQTLDTLTTQLHELQTAHNSQTSHSSHPSHLPPPPCAPTPPAQTKKTTPKWENPANPPQPQPDAPGNPSGNHLGIPGNSRELPTNFPPPENQPTATPSESTPSSNPHFDSRSEHSSWASGSKGLGSPSAFRIPQSPPFPPHPSGLPIPQDWDSDLTEAALDLAEHTTGKSPLDKLAQSERDALFKLLQTHSPESVVDLLAQPRPLGLDLKIGKSSLYRFKDRYEYQARERQGLEVIRGISEAFGKDGLKTEQDFHTMTQHVIASRLFTCSADPKYDYRKIHSLVRSLNSLRRQRLIEMKTYLKLSDQLAAPPKSKPTPPPHQTPNP